MRRIRTLPVLLAAILVGASGAPAFAALELSTDQRALFFGLMRLGEEKVLSQSGSYHNAVTCTSTGGVPWYLKISALRPLAFGGESIPLEGFQWQLTRTTGTGTVSHRSRFRVFRAVPDLVYVSSPEEAAGRPVEFRFRYSLTIPDVQPSGAYHTTIRFTLTEIL